MILGLLLGAADPEWERLFGDAGTSETAATSVPAATPTDAAPVAGPPEIPGFVLPIVVLGAAAMGAVALRRAKVRQVQGELRVLQRESLGDRSALVLVEVATADGELRRLLIGTGGGPPTLVSDLGGGFDPPPALLAAAAVSPPPSRPAVAPEPAPQPPRAQRPTPVNIAEEVLAERRSRGRFLTLAGEDE